MVLVEYERTKLEVILAVFWQLFYSRPSQYARRVRIYTHYTRECEHPPSCNKINKRTTGQGRLLPSPEHLYYALSPWRVCAHLH